MSSIIMKHIVRLKNQRVARLYACRLISPRNSIIYGLYFSTPLSIALVSTGVLLGNLYLLVGMVLVTIGAIVLSMHPFDYVYNRLISKSIGSKRIPGRGTELQFTSTYGLVFNLVALGMVVLDVSLHMGILVSLYIATNALVIAILLYRRKSSA